jgi:hypothetical protein
MSFSADIGHNLSRLNLKERNPTRLNILIHHKIGDVEMVVSIIYFGIVTNVDGSLIIAKYGSISNQDIEFFDGRCEPDPMFQSACKCDIFALIHRSP